MNKNSYRLFDLFIFTAIASAIEGVNVLLFNMMKFHIGSYEFSAVFTLSFACVLGMIAIFRWNMYGLIVAPVAGIVSMLVRLALGQEVTMNLWLSYSLGYLGLAVCLLFVYKRDKKKLREDKGQMLIYYFVGYLVVELIKSLCQIGSANYWVLLLNYVSFDLINIVVGAAIFYLALKQDGLVVDMEQYLVDLKEFQSRMGGQQFVSKNININVEEMCEADEINEAAILDGGTLSREDLKKMEETRRKLEHKVSKFDAENEEFEAYKKSKEAKKHGAR